MAWPLSAEQWTGSVNDGWRYISYRLDPGAALSSLGIVSDVQTDNNDALTQGTCFANKAYNNTIAGKPWFSVYFTNDFPTAVTIANAKIYVQHQGASGTSGDFVIHVSADRSVSRWYAGDTVGSAANSGDIPWNATEQTAVYDVTGILNTPGKVNNCEVLLLNKSTSAGAVYFDYVALVVEYTLASPPAVDNDGGASALQPDSATLNGNLTSGLPSPTAYVYWGDNDGGVSTGAWDHAQLIGAPGLGAFSTVVTGLLANQTYYYRCYATNAYGVDWADSTSTFGTPSPTVQFAAAVSSNAESVSPVSVSIVLSHRSAVPVSVNFSVTGGSALNGVDYSLAPGVAIIPAGGTSTGVTFTVADDAQVESSETVVIGLSTPVGATLGANVSHTYTILDNDVGPPIVDNDSGATGITSAGATLRGDLGATGKLTTQVRIYWGETDGGTATGGWQHVESLGSREIGPFSAAIAGLIANKTYYYRCYATNSAGQDWADSTASFATLPPAIDFAAVTSSWTEAAGAIQMPVRLSNASATDVSANYAAVGGTAANGSDYTLAPGVVTIRAGNTATGVTFTIINDAIDEYDETVVVRLSNPLNATLGVNVDHTLTILDDDSPPPVSFLSATYTFFENLTNAVVAIAPASVAGKPMLVSYATADGSAVAGADYGATNGTLAWNPGETNSKAISVPLIDTPEMEDDEAFTVSLSAPSNCTLGAISNTTVTIKDKDKGPPQIDNDGGATAVTLNAATLNGFLRSWGGADSAVWFFWGESDGGTDRASWASNRLAGTLRVNAPFSHALTGLRSGQIYYYRSYATNIYGEAWAAATTNFTTLLPTVSLVATQYNVSEISGSVVVTVRLNQTSERSPEVAMTAAGGTAAPGRDYAATNAVLRWPAYASGERTFTIPILNNSFADGSRTVYAVLWNTAGCTVAGERAARITIAEDDQSLPQITNAEGASDVRATRATLNGRVLSGYPAPGVTIYWGPVDGGTSPGAWAGQVGTGQQSGAFARLVTGLTTNRAYYYRAYATNAAGAAWAPATTNFTTTPGREFYVNDTSTVNDVYCSAVGNDANTGTSPAAPKATVAAILSGYDLDGGDTVYIDTGVYNLTNTLQISGLHAGTAGRCVTFMGSTNAAGTILKRNDISQHLIRVSGAGADYLRFESLRLTAARSGLRVEGTSGDRRRGIEISGCRAYDNSASGDGGIVLRYCTGGFVQNCVASGNGYSGIALDACVGTLLDRNECFGNVYYGLSALSCTDPALVRNLCHNQTHNDSYGIAVGYGSGEKLEGNTCYSNAIDGIFISGQASLVITNLCYANGENGINLFSPRSTARGNVVYGNGLNGILADGNNGQGFSNNVVWDNGNYGVAISGTQNSLTFERNTLVGGSGLYLKGPQSVVLRNNIIWADGSGEVAIEVGSPPGGAAAFASQYNDLYASGGAGVGKWGATFCTTLPAWRQASSNDLTSISADPLFVDPWGEQDFHLMSAAGSYHGAEWVSDPSNSPCIDAGAPGSDYAAELSYNGFTINQGAYAGTPAASKTFYAGPWYSVALSASPPVAGVADIRPAAPAYPTNRLVTVWATLTNSAYEWKRWTADISGTNLTNSFLVSSNMSVVAEFERQSWIISTSAGTGGSILPAGDVPVPDGSNVTFSITAAPHFAIAGVKVDGASVGVTNAWTFLNVTQDHTLSATFAPLGGTAAKGTPLWWLELNGFTNNYDQAEVGDQDGDGAPTWEEYLAGTVPTSRWSVFRVIDLGARGGSNYVTWYATTNSGVLTGFRIYGCTNLAVGTWQFVTGGIQRSTSGTNTWWTVAAPDAAPRHYRPALPPTNQ